MTNGSELNRTGGFPLDSQSPSQGVEMTMTEPTPNWTDTQVWYARNFPESPLNDEQRRCLDVLAAVERIYNLWPTGRRGRLDGGFRPCGTGIEVRLPGGSLSTFDGDGLTRLVLAAHRHVCRVDVSSSRGGLLVLRVHPRSAEGGLFERHPTLSDLAAAIEEHG